jgi:hypothetical protein
MSNCIWIKEELLSNPERYCRLVGKLNYLTITKSYISFAVCGESIYG